MEQPRGETPTSMIVNGAAMSERVRDSAPTWIGPAVIIDRPRRCRWRLRHRALWLNDANRAMTKASRSTDVGRVDRAQGMDRSGCDRDRHGRRRRGCAGGQPQPPQSAGRPRAAGSERLRDPFRLQLGRRRPDDLPRPTAATLPGAARAAVPERDARDHLHRADQHVHGGRSRDQGLRLRRPVHRPHAPRAAGGHRQDPSPQPARAADQSAQPRHVRLAHRHLGQRAPGDEAQLRQRLRPRAARRGETGHVLVPLPPARTDRGAGVRWTRRGIRRRRAAAAAVPGVAGHP